MRLPAGYPEIVACTLAWGSLGLIRKEIDLSSAPVVFFRLSFGAIVVLAWLAARGRLGELRPRARPGLLVASGIVLGTHWITEFEAYRRLDVGPTILIVFLGPVLMAAAAPAVLGERLHPVALAALAAAFGGIALIAVPDLGTIDGWGLAAALASAVLFALLLLLGKLLTRHYEPAAIVAWQLGIAAVLVSPSLAGASAAAIARALPWLLLLGVAFTGVAGILFFRAVRALEAQRLGVIFYLEPASAVVYAWVFRSEEPTALVLAGGALIVAAGIATVLSDRQAAAAGMPELVVQETRP